MSGLLLNLIRTSDRADNCVYRRCGSVARTSVFDWRTFPDVWLTCDYFVGKVSTMGQPTNSAFHPFGVGKWVVIHGIRGETIKRQTRAARVVVWLWGWKPVCEGLAYSLLVACPLSDRTAPLQLQLPLVVLYKCYAFYRRHSAPAVSAADHKPHRDCAFSFNGHAVWTSLEQLTCTHQTSQRTLVERS